MKPVTIATYQILTSKRRGEYSHLSLLNVEDWGLSVGSKIMWGKLTGKRWTTAGAALQGRMLQQVLKAGVDLRL